MAMFDSLSERLSQSLRNLTGVARLSEDNIKDTLREVRMALLEADVALDVVKPFVEKVKDEALGQEVMQSLDPGQAFVKIVNEQLIKVLGPAFSGLNLAHQTPVVILMAGLQGAGKTTSVAKLAKWIKEEHKKSVIVASADVYRPAAIKQLEMLAQEVGAKFFASDSSQKPIDIARGAISAAKSQLADVLILDTAGRLHIDEEMMAEIKALHQAIKPAETLFVVDAMTGQDAAKTAKAFNEVLAITGVILSKADGDTRGGAALSVAAITGKPIKFLGIGEKVDGLEAFHPERIASRILGMGDILTLVEEAEKKLDKKKAERLAQKFKKGKSFDLEDLKDQFQQMRNMGGMASMVEKLPGMGQMAEALQSTAQQKQMMQMEAIIDSMTPKERRKPDIINGSRKKRIAAGSGTQIQDVNRLLKQHMQMQKMMKKLKQKGGMANLMRGLGGMTQGGGFTQR